VRRTTAAWHVATVAETRPETPTARRIVLDISTWPGNDAGQHLDIRLTAPDGYQASRSYSIASSGPVTRLELAIDEVPDGEVSPFLVRELRVGDELEVHGPLGGFFVWRPSETPTPPVQLIAGGSGVVPLVAMVRAHAAAGDITPFRLLYSVRTPDDIFFAKELADAEASAAPLRLDVVYTRRGPAGSPAVPGRLTTARLVEVVVAPAEQPHIFVCGPTGFVEAVAGWLVELGHPAASIKTERFGG
jgi:ferredoxin-NADP reductase